MANYNIYVLGENNMTISDGGQLDGVNQGDGSHLEGLSITLTSGAWQPVSIADDDFDFRDNDTSQTLDGNQSVNGVPYSSGTIVEAEYGITVTDGTFSWTMIGFNVRDSPTSYATVEGLALIQSPQGPPPTDVPLFVTSSFEGPNFQQDEYSQPVCFVTGTFLDTPTGPLPVEQIKPGMAIQTRDHGVRVVLWTGHRRVLGTASFAPVMLPVGFMGNTTPLMVSQQHKILLTDWRAELYFGARDVLVPAKHLVSLNGAKLIQCGPIGYHHVLLEDHALLASNGIWSESFCLGSQALKSLLPHAKTEITAQFPELIRRKSSHVTLREFETRVLKQFA